jgi:hypothetical protein
VQSDFFFLVLRTHDEVKCLNDRLICFRDAKEKTFSKKWLAEFCQFWQSFTWFLSGAVKIEVNEQPGLIVVK